MTMDHEPLLSSEETDALLAAVRASGGVDEPAPADLASSDRPLRDAIGRATKVTLKLTQVIPKVLLRLATCPSAGEEITPEIASYSRLFSELEPGSALVNVETPDGATATMVIGPTLTGFLLTRQMGAPMPENPLDVPLRLKLSSVDQRILRPLATGLLEAFGKCWSDNPNAFRVVSIPADANEKPEVNELDAILRVAVRLQILNGPADVVTFALPVAAVLAITPRETRVIATREQPPEERVRLAERIGSTEVEVVAVLGTAHSSIRSMLDLSVGDVLRLEQVPDDPVHICVENIPVLRGSPIVHHGNLSIEVKDAPVAMQERTQPQ